eukprot:Gb_10099 [translate_table: standard]
MKVRDSMSVTFVVLYVDDLLITGNDVSMISDLKKDLKMNFEMTDLAYCIIFWELKCGKRLYESSFRRPNTFGKF